MSHKSKKDIIAIVGPTASGKTRFAVALAKRLTGEIISADSRQVYKGMDIGTGKDLQEYGNIPYHIIDVCDAGEKYNLYRYIKDFREALQIIRERDKHPVVCGGTGMYVENALSGISLPEVPVNTELRQSLSEKSLDDLAELLKTYKLLHNKTDIDTVKRAIRAIEIEEYYLTHPEKRNLSRKDFVIPEKSLIIGIDIPREERRKRISLRLEKRLEEGLIEEIQQLLSSGITAENLIYYGLEYKFVTLHVTGVMSYEDMKSQLETAIHQFAKRQMTWFRGMEKRGFHIYWLPHDLDDEEFCRRVVYLYEDFKNE